MGRWLLYILIAITALGLLVSPWITGLAYVLNSLLQPQYLWPWVFNNVPVFRITAGLAIIGALFQLSSNKENVGIYKNSQNALLLIIFLFMHLSDMFSPFKGAPSQVPPEVVLKTINSIFIMYFIILTLVQKERALEYLCYTFIFVGLYYVYWANSAYLNQEWFRFEGNRLKGPSGSPYADGNALSVLLVMCLPFLILLYFRTGNRLVRFSIIIMVPLSWHALILFSSRAALLASVITLILVGYIVRSKKFNIIIGLSFCAFLAYQGALVLNRTTETIDKVGHNEQEPINPRLLSWSIGFKLIPKYPILGVGVQKFQAASLSHFPDAPPYVAHNTFLNFSVNSGLISGLCYLLLIYIVFKRLRRCRVMVLNLNNTYYYALTSSSIGILGFFICSIFLDLIVFEPFYVLLIINLISWNRLVSEQRVDAAKNA